MLSTSFANLFNYFYPVGNTPAVSLAQGLPPGAAAKVLLLGCGDVRHLLFTLHIDPRPLDVTACDLQPAVIARNVLILTLINESNAAHDKSNWDLYFHFKIDDASLNRLQTQAQKLLLLSATLESWKASDYGQIFKFCDESTLRKAREMWMLWVEWDSADQARFNESLQKSMEVKLRKGDGMNITGLRSAAPAFIDAMKDLPDLHNHYWKHGTADISQGVFSEARNINPMFALPLADQILHYGTDPLLGFHLATAYAPLADEVGKKGTGQHKGLQRVVDAAKAEFAAWTNSFRKNSEQQALSIRFFIGDAIAFSLHLRHTRAGLGQSPSGWYRDRAHFEPIALGVDYASGGSAPTSFDVIDTSNLVDHVGALNLLLAVEPLLKHNLSATLYTEKLLKLSATRKDLVDDLIGGHLPTLSTLLGLVSMEMVTNTSTISAGDESIVHMSLRQAGEVKSSIGQQFVRLAWKRPISMGQPQLCHAAIQKIDFDAVEMAHVFHSVYLNMFQGEDFSSLLRNLTTAENAAMGLHKSSLPNYHRASFAGFLRFAKSRVNVDWNVSISTLLRLIESNSTYIMSRNYIQELYVWLHIFDVYTVGALVASPCQMTDRTASRDLRSWDSIPAVVCVTLEVPRERLTVFNTRDSTIGTPPLDCSVRSPPDCPAPYENNFAALQTGFGKVSTSGNRFSTSFKVEVKEDGSAWSGNLPLVVSFYVPAWILLLEPQKTVLSFGLQSTPQTASRFTRELGLQLTLFKTTLGDSQHVYVSKNLPNLSRKPTMSSFVEYDWPQHDTGAYAKPTLHATVSRGSGNIITLTNHINLQGNLGTILSRGCEVHLKALSPFNFEISLGGSTSIFVNFPVPVAYSKTKTRIARKSSYIELVATVEAVVPSMGSFTHPLLQTSSGAMLWNLPFLNLDLQPALDISQPARLHWLNIHVFMMFSSRQRHLRENRNSPAAVGERTPVELKDSLFSLFMIYSGVQGKKTSVFGIACPTAGGVHIVLLVSHLRIDVSSRTVILDAAAIPLYDELMPQIRPFLQVLTARNICQVSATKDEMGLWKQMLPAWSERCRSWRHRDDCEYVVAKRIPLSSEVGQRCLCSCGNGKFPANYLRGMSQLNGILQYAVRVAISPLFHSALVDDPYSIAESPNSCNSCGNGSQGSELLQCAGCRRVQYCSKACQRTDWKRHKPSCQMMNEKTV